MTASLELVRSLRARGFVGVLRLEEWLALVAFGVLGVLKWQFGGGVRWLTYFTVRGLGLFAALAVLYLATSIRHEHRLGRMRVRAVVGHGLAFLRDFLPFVALIVIYENLLPLIGRIRPVLYDELAFRADLALFGATPSTWLAPLFTRARSEWFAFFYLGLFALPIVSGGLLYLGGRRRDFREFMLTFTLAGLVGFVGYLALPVVGPRYYLHERIPLGLGSNEAGVLETSFSALAARANELHAGFGRARNCFPSLHTAWGLIVLVFAYRQMRWLFFLYLVPVGSLLIATIYLRFHYAVDLVAGALLALLLCALAPRLARRFPVAEPKAAPILTFGPRVGRLAAHVRRFCVAHWPYLALAMLVGPIYASSLPTGITTHNRGEDGAELVAAAITGGTAHPPGYPLYTLLLRAACALARSAEPITVAHAFSAVAALLAGALVISLCRAWFASLPSRSGRGSDEVAAFVAGVLFCFSPALFRQALIAEVYAFHALAIACVLRLAAHLALAEGPPRLRDVAWFGLAGGLAISHHLTAAPVLLALGLVLASLSRVRRMGLRGVLAGAYGVTLGFLPWVYLPLAAAQHPVLSWGRPDSFARFIWVVSAAQYRYRLGGHAADWLTHFKGQFPLWHAPALVLAFATAGFAAPVVERRQVSPRARSVAALVAALIAANVLSSLPYSIADLESYFIPSELGCAAFAGLGICVVGRALGSLPALRQRSEGVVIGLAVPLLLAGLAWNIRRADAHGQSNLDRRVRAIVGAAAPGALIAARGDGMVFGLWYERFVRSERGDIDIVSRELLLQPWYRDNRGHFTASMRWPDDPLRGNASRRLSAVILANYGARPIVVVDPADVPSGCVRASSGLLTCEPLPAPESGG